MNFPIYEKIENVPNHQPEEYHIQQEKRAWGLRELGYHNVTRCKAT